jgi:hypothetical protein
MANNRYSNIPVIKGTNNKRVTRAVLYPPIPKTLDDIYVITNTNDRLDLLAYKYYGDVNLAWIIAEANGVGKGTHVLSPGLQLRIPTQTISILTEYRNLNS